MKPKSFLSLALILLTGCTIGPDYKRPALNVPEHFRATVRSPGTAGISIGEEKWWEVFQDRQLQDLIHEALQQNYDVRIAASRVMQAQAQLDDITGHQLPDISAQASDHEVRMAENRGTKAFKQNLKRLNLAMDWELDFWGRGRRAIEASRAGFFASQWASREVLTSLVAEVAGAYFQLRELDLELQISQRALVSRRHSLKLTRLLAQHGSTSLLDVRQAEQLVYTAAQEIPDLQRRIEQQENLLSILLGTNPGPIGRGLPMAKQARPPVVPVGVPSSVLQRRADIMQAEQQLQAANAGIGVAQGVFFPDISLTGTGGFQSSALARLFEGPSGFWDLAAQASQPIFNGGRLKAQLRLARAQQQEALWNYKKTVQGAFRDVSDALVAYAKDQQVRHQQFLLTRSATDAERISNLRYKAGAASYLEVLDSNTRSYTAQIALAQAQLNELESLVQLYKSLGGGWQ